MDLDSCQIIVEDIGASKCRAGDEAPEFVLLMQTHQLHINPLPQVFHAGGAQLSRDIQNEPCYTSVTLFCQKEFEFK